MNGRAGVTQVMRAMPLHAPGSDGIGLVRAHLWKLDLGSLLASLRALGYGWDELRFRSHASIEAPRRLIHDVEALDEPRRVVVTLNFGLLGPQSPLPSYFWKELDAGKLDAASFHTFVGFLDEIVLARQVAALHPELERQRPHEDLQLLNLHAGGTLHWLFQSVYPELAVRVAPLAKGRRVRTGSLRVGSAVLGGDDLFGGVAVAPALGHCVTLFAEEDQAGSGRPWAIEARSRLETYLLPLLRPVGVTFEVALVVREQQLWTRLDGGSHLGYEALRGRQARRTIHIHDTSKEDGR